MVDDGPGAFFQQFAGFRRYGTDGGSQLRFVRNDVGSVAGLEFPTVITAMSPGVALRETTVCSAITISEPVTMGSTPSCGMEPWEPFP